VSDQEQFQLDDAQCPLHLFVSQLGWLGFDPRTNYSYFDGPRLVGGIEKILNTRLIALVAMVMSLKKI